MTDKSITCLRSCRGYKLTPLWYDQLSSLRVYFGGLRKTPLPPLIFLTWQRPRLKWVRMLLSVWLPWKHWSYFSLWWLMTLLQSTWWFTFNLCHLYDREDKWLIGTMAAFVLSHCSSVSWDLDDLRARGKIMPIVLAPLSDQYQPSSVDWRNLISLTQVLRNRQSSEIQPS